QSERHLRAFADGGGVDPSGTSAGRTRLHPICHASEPAGPEDWSVLPDRRTSGIGIASRRSCRRVVPARHRLAATQPVGAPLLGPDRWAEGKKGGRGRLVKMVRDPAAGPRRWSIDGPTAIGRQRPAVAFTPGPRAAIGFGVLIRATRSFLEIRRGG